MEHIAQFGVLYPLLLPDQLHQYPFPPPAVELAVEDLLPRPEVQPAVGDRNRHLAT